MTQRFFGRGEGTQHVKKRKDTYRPLHDLARVRPYRPQRAHFTVEHSSTVILPEIAEQAECLRTDAIKTINFPFPDYKAPLAPKREF